MEREIGNLVRNYQMGLITAQEFIGGYQRMLDMLGAGRELSEITNRHMSKLANALVGIVSGNGKLVEDINVEEL